MAKIYNNIFVLGLTGALSDQFMNFETRSGKTILASKAMFDDNQEYAKTQNMHQAIIREACTSANFAQAQEVYINQAKATGATAYSTAVTDWSGAPEVLEIDVDDWTGEIGQPIHVKARDTVMVARVSVVIRDAQENVLEMGEAVQSEAGSDWWDYITKSLVPMNPFPIVEAIAQDLPGNSDSFVIS